MNTRTRATLVLATLLGAAPAARAQATKSASTVAQSAGATVIAKEKSLFDALMKKDFDAFNKALGSDFTYVDATGPTRWELAKSAEMLKTCTTGKWTMEDAKAEPVGTDIIVLTYKATGEQTCNGKKAPSPAYAMSVWQKRMGKWVAVAHSETPAAPK